MLGIVSLMIVGLPLAAAELPAAVAPPMDLTATAVEGGVQLAWNPPVDAPPGATYAVYRDGLLLDGMVDGLAYFDEAPSSSMSVYAVTAVTASGESLPAVVPSNCINTTLNPPTFPFVYIQPDECDP